MISSLKANPLNGSEKSFNMYIEYRNDGTEKIKNGKFFDAWIISE